MFFNHFQINPFSVDCAGVVLAAPVLFRTQAEAKSTMRAQARVLLALDCRLCPVSV